MQRLFIILALAASSATLAQTWPTKPIRVIVPFPPGGGTDIVARTVTPKMAEILGQPFVIENRAGAGGNIGLDAVAKLAVRRFIRDLNREEGTTVILTTHDMNDIEALTDRIFTEDAQGEIIPDTPAARLMVRGWSAMGEEMVLTWAADPAGVTREQLLEALAVSLPGLVDILH